MCGCETDDRGLCLLWGVTVEQFAILLLHIVSFFDIQLPLWSALNCALLCDGRAAGIWIFNTSFVCLFCEVWGGVTPSCALLCAGLTQNISRVCVAGALSCALLCDGQATGI